MLRERGYTSGPIEKMRIKDLVQALIETDAGHTDTPRTKMTEMTEMMTMKTKTQKIKTQKMKTQKTKSHKMEAQKMNLATEKITKEPPITAPRWGS